MPSNQDLADLFPEATRLKGVFRQATNLRVKKRTPHVYMPEPGMWHERGKPEPRSLAEMSDGALRNAIQLCKQKKLKAELEIVSRCLTRRLEGRPGSRVIVVDWSGKRG
jgi:hypothetical protein